MSDDQPKRRREIFVGCLATAIFLSPILYVLSTGPAIWLYDHGYIGGEVGWIYLPLEYLNDHVPFVKSFLDWYTPFWGPVPRQPPRS